LSSQIKILKKLVFTALLYIQYVQL